MSPRAYLLTLLALLALTGLSWWASFFSLGAWEAPVAYGIAAVKVALVALVFMHLATVRAADRLFAVGGVLIVLLLVSLAAAEVVMRTG